MSLKRSKGVASKTKPKNRASQARILRAPRIQPPKISFYQAGDFARVAEVGSSSAAEPYRTDFRRDYARVLHSPAFRRLQRKTQLFPGDESDFFRNRLTHSLEVAQIAKSIALRLNYIVEARFPGSDGISPDLVEIAGLAHDLGHPPFGHTGEHALHSVMFSQGGFEGNAQTLRILSKLEKRQTLQGRATSSLGSDFSEFSQTEDLRAGLNLTYRTLASILKYDNMIPLIGGSALAKGYYASELPLVDQIKRHVLGDKYEKYKDRKLKVIEMQIMDLADDIAYSTYDFEDALKAGFGTPLDLLQQMNNNEELRNAVACKLFKSKYEREYNIDAPSPDDLDAFAEIQRKMVTCVLDMMKSFLIEIDNTFTSDERSDFVDGNTDDRTLVIASVAVTMQKLSDAIAKNGYVRAQFTSDLIGKRVRQVGIEINEECPCLSRVIIDEDARFEIDVLKHMTYELHIKSPRLKLIEYRGNQIVEELFLCFESDKSGELLPNDWRERLKACSGFAEKEELRKRLICDYIAGMTDAYALDMYSRLKTTNPAALFRPT